ncbi:hypothetical protein D3C84_994010 [compost metagenome]
MHAGKIADVLAHGFVEHAAAPFPAAQIADDFVQEQVRQLFPFIPMLDFIEIFRPPHAPIQVHRVLETRRPAMLDQAVHLRHAGSGGDQHQRAIGQFRQMRVAKRHLDTHVGVAP